MLLLDFQVRREQVTRIDINSLVKLLAGVIFQLKAGNGSNNHRMPL
jgi:hypothetical protein